MEACCCANAVGLLICGSLMRSHANHTNAPPAAGRQGESFSVSRNGPRPRGALSRSRRPRIIAFLKCRLASPSLVVVCRDHSPPL